MKDRGKKRGGGRQDGGIRAEGRYAGLRQRQHPISGWNAVIISLSRPSSSAPTSLSSSPSPCKFDSGRIKAGRARK